MFSFDGLSPSTSATNHAARCHGRNANRREEESWAMGRGMDSDSAESGWNDDGILWDL